MKNKNLERDYKKTKDTIISCYTPDQLKVGVKMFNRLTDLYDMSDEQVNKLKNLIGLMRIKCNVEEINEGESQIDKTFHKYTQMTGVPEIQQLRFNEAKKGGVSEDMSPEDLAEKHDVDLKDIKKEINLGTKIEMEHTDSKEEAKRIAMDHVFEFSDYYSDPMFGIVAIEKFKGGERKTIRISKGDMDKLHNDGSIVVDGIEVKFPVSEDFNFNRAVRKNKKERKDELSKRLTKNDVFDKIDELKNNNYSELKSSEEEDIEEATGAAGSSGSYVGPFSKINKRPFKKSDITNNIPTSVTGLPIGKMYSFNEEKEVLEEEDELDEATSFGSVGGVYDTPGFPASEFMGTKGKKGKAPVKKSQKNDVLKNLGYKKVRVKEKCKRFPYCNQSPDAIELYNESFKITKDKVKLKYKK